VLQDCIHNRHACRGIAQYFTLGNNGDKPELVQFWFPINN